ncbi:MAG: heat-inducible transcriptional repressor HrcA [Candidatus Bipolaricaulota bacterium]|nr:heat-inducible transcriptional repressor HrcA [Candidatus Bipolaricaulota bacterium]
MLPERHRLVLKEIVDRYVKRHEPVSSRMLIEDYGLHVSSATVRNDMNALEASGYIEKPYSSSGRIPTKKGYRFFVDWLLDLSQLTRPEYLGLVEFYEVYCREITDMMRQTAFLLGNITGYAGFVVSPRLEESQLERVVLTRIGPRLVMLAIISDVGIVEHSLIHLQQDSPAGKIERMMRLINDNLYGMSLREVRSLALHEGPKGWHERPMREALFVLRDLLEQRMGQHLYVEGILNVAKNLQAADSENAMKQFSSLIHAVQDENTFIETITNRRADKEGLVIAVGDCPLPGLEDYSLVTSDYRPYSGLLGVIAPLWMDYGKALSTTSYIANRLEALLIAACRRGSKGDQYDERQEKSRTGSQGKDP